MMLVSALVLLGGCGDAGDDGASERDPGSVQDAPAGADEEVTMPAEAARAAASSSDGPVADDPGDGARSPGAEGEEPEARGSEEHDDDRAGDDGHAHGDGGDGDDGPAGVRGRSDAPSGITIDVEVGDRFVRTESSRLDAGDVTFIARNVGTDEHELRIARAASIPRGGIQRMDEDAVQRITLRRTGTIEPGEGGSDVSITLERGRYVLFCARSGHHADGHLAAGQWTEIIVT